MDILEETDVFLSACQLTQDEYNNLVFNGITVCFESKYLADWFVNQINFGWKLWQAAKAQAVPEKIVKLHLVWNENKDECVGFLDSKDARYTATGDDRGMFGVTALGDYFRDLNDERNEFETQIVMIEARKPAND